MNDSPVESGGAGGRDPALESRVATLEGEFRSMRLLLERIDERMKYFATKEDLAKVREDLAKVANDVARIEGRVSQLPTTITLLGFVLAVLAAGGFMRHFFP